MSGRKAFKKEQKKLERKWAKQRAKRGYSDADWWNIDAWFIQTASQLLKKLRKYHHGYPAGILSDEERTAGKDPDKKWCEILDRMIFLIHEMDEGKCSKKNPNQKDVEKANAVFVRQYGFFGDRYNPTGEKPETGKKNSRVWKTAADVPENAALFEAWADSEQEIAEYRDECKDKFFELFSKYFWNLWD